MSLSEEHIQFIAHQAYEIRRLSVIMTTNAGSGHPTSVLSCADIVACLFFHTMRYNLDDFDYPENDRFILSKGHAAPVLYAVWNLLGKVSEDELMTYRKMGSVIEGHPTRRFKYAEAATGSLGQGLSIGLGYELSRKLHNHNFYTYVLLGDSENSEGSVWEAAEIATYYKADHLTAIIDVNRLGQSTETLWNHDLQQLKKVWDGFGWHSFIVDGHNINEIIEALDESKNVKNKPTVILAHTFKGHGIDWVEDEMGFHGKAISKEKLDKALEELRINFPEAARYHSSKTWTPLKPTVTKFQEQKKEPLAQPAYQVADMIATRVAYGQALAGLGVVNSQVVALDAEVKNSTYAELFEKEFPHRFFQCFIAEQNMVGMGVGFARRGNIPFVSTFGAFQTRAFDQTRMAAIGQVALRMCGSHAGVSIGEDGPSQMALEDIALMRSLIDSIVLYPSDAVSCYKLVGLMCDYEKGISYLRTTRPKTPVIYTNDEEFQIGGCKVHKKSDADQAVLVGAGITLHEALKAHDFLKVENIDTAVIDLYSIKPLDYQTLIKTAQSAGNFIVTIEDHYKAGGIGEAVCSALKSTNITIESLAVTKLPLSGTLYDQLAYQGIDASSITNFVKKMLQER